MRRLDSGIDDVALHSAAATRRIESRAQADLPPHALMRRAGEATARLALALAPHARRVWIAAGPGNNGGDGLEAATCLAASGRAVGVRLLGDPAALPADASDALERARQAGVAIDVPFGDLVPGDLAIDALLGIGASRPPTGDMADAVRLLNAAPCAVLSIDVPSGLDVDTGRAFGLAVRARHTLTLLTAKPGLFTASGRDHAGAVWLDGLGLEPADEPADALLVGSGSTFARREPRDHAAHKGSFGDVAVVGGASGMVGAAMLAARAAHASGAGRTFVGLLTDAGDAPGHDPLRPELMFRRAWWDAPATVLANTVVLCGCGGGDAVREVLPRLLSLASRLVLDADALNAVATDRGLAGTLRARGRRGFQTVLTPHPLEAARLLGTTTSEVQADRLQAARELAQMWHAVIVLKGSGTVIGAPNRVSAICATGNAALATAGTGDVLAGWLAGAWAQGDGTAWAYDIAVRAVVEHGAAADPIAAGPLLAEDLIEVLHRRLRSGHGQRPGAGR
jgi:hydroxyethylthiazole kinase-like uncharacterized protein yjeF